jgi:nitrate reductase assembly molybdenum cofactor insertion protein NarJ
MTETATLAGPRLQELLSEAAAWRLLGLLLERPRGGWREEVESLSREIHDPEITAALEAAREEASEGLYLALLGPGGVISPREVSYRGMNDPGQVLSDIKAFFEAFAFHPETEEAPDHLAVEAGFLGYLTLKEAYARARGNEEEAAIVSQALARFREEHLCTLAWPLADRLEKTDAQYLSLAARALARRAGPRPAAHPAGKGPLPQCVPDCPLECGQD